MYDQQNAIFPIKVFFTLINELLKIGENETKNLK